MKKILLYILIFTTITGGLFGIFGGVNNEENKSSILGVDEVYAKVCIDDDDPGVISEIADDKECPKGSSTAEEQEAAKQEKNDARAAKAAASDSSLKLYGITCSLWSGFNMGSCITTSAFYLQNISTIVFHGSALLFNKMLAFSMDSSIIDQQFVKTTWGATRGFANMLFILVLVAISISIILNVGKYANKQLIVRVIVIALAVNFSLFASRVIIDAGNIIALGFYDAIQAEYKGGDALGDAPSKVGKGIEEKDISGAIVQGFNPTVMFGPDSFKKWRDTNKLSNTVSNTMLSVVFFMSSGILLYTAYIFFMASFIFIVRIAWLWILMALAPLAFISYTIPQLEQYWKDWWKQLLNRSFAIVVFMFLMWLTLTIVSSDFLDSAFGVVSGEGGAIKAGGSIVDFMVIIFMQFAVVITLLRLTLSATKKMSDDGGVGDKMLGMVKGVGALALGAATGGTTLAAGVAARQAIGKTASVATGAMEKRGVGSGFVGKTALQFSRGVENYNFGTKEGFKDRKERVKTEELKHIQSLPEEVYEYEKTGARKGEIKLDAQGKKVVKRDSAGQEIKPQERRIENLRSRAPISWTLGNRAGQLAAVESHEKLKGLEVELENKTVIPKTGLKEDLKKMNVELSTLQDKKKVKDKEENISTDSPAMVGMRDTIETKKQEIESKRAEIKKVQEKIKKSKGEVEKGTKKKK